MEILELSERHEDDNSLTATANLEFASSGDVQIVKISLQLVVGSHLILM